MISIQETKKGQVRNSPASNHGVINEQDPCRVHFEFPRMFWLISVSSDCQTVQGFFAKDILSHFSCGRHEVCQRLVASWVKGEL